MEKGVVHVVTVAGRFLCGFLKLLEVLVGECRQGHEMFMNVRANCLIVLTRATGVRIVSRWCGEDDIAILICRPLNHTLSHLLFVGNYRHFHFLRLRLLFFLGLLFSIFFLFFSPFTRVVTGGRVAARVLLLLARRKFVGARFLGSSRLGGSFLLS